MRRLEAIPRLAVPILSLAVFCPFSTTPTHAQLPPFDWMRTSTKAYQFGPGRGVAVDADGNCFIVGAIGDGADFDGTIINTRDDIDAFVAKYAPNGDLLWVKNVGGLNPNAAEEDMANGVDVDALGNCYFTGQIGDSAFFDSTTILINGEADVFVAKYDPGGNVVWVQRAGSAGEDGGNDIVVSGGGDCYVTGFLGGTAADFGDTTLASTDGDGFLAKYDTDGALQWVSHFSGTGPVRGSGVALAPTGECIVVGLNDGTATIGDSVFTSTGFSDGFVAKFDSSGGFQWAVQSNPPDVMRAAGVDSDGAIFVVGDYCEPFFIRIGLYMAKYTDGGQLQWADTLLASGIGADVVPTNIAVEPDGCSITTGWFDQSTTFGDSTFNPIGADAFIITRDSSGAITDALQGGNGPVIFNAFQSGTAVDIDSGGNVVVSLEADHAIEIADTTLEFSGDARHVLLRFSDTPSGIVTNAMSGRGVTLSQNAPNPFNPATVIHYRLSRAADVRMDIYDVSGRHVHTLVRGQLPPGQHVAVWDGVTDSGSLAATGIYFYRLQAGNVTRTKRMVLLK